MISFFSKPDLGLSKRMYQLTKEDEVRFSLIFPNAAVDDYLSIRSNPVYGTKAAGMRIPSLS